MTHRNNGEDDLIVHFNLLFDPYRGLVSASDLLAIFLEEMAAKNSRFFANLTVDPTGLEINEVTGLLDVPVTAASPMGIQDAATVSTTFAKIPQVRCETLQLPYCKSIGYNVTAYPNLLGKFYAPMRAFFEFC